MDAHEVRRVTRLFETLGTYLGNVGWEGTPETAAVDFLSSRPPHTPRHDKHPFVVQYAGEDIGVVDLIHGYPSEEVAFIGLLAVVAGWQGHGLGRQVYLATERFAGEALGVSRLRLAVVEGNPVRGFWERMGFSATGEAGAYGSGKRAFLMERILR